MSDFIYFSNYLFSVLFYIHLYFRAKNANKQHWAERPKYKNVASNLVTPTQCLLPFHFWSLFDIVNVFLPKYMRKIQEWKMIQF